MQSLKDKFEELRHRLGHGRRFDSASTEPIYYLVFPVADILEAKRQTKAWVAKLSHDNWNVVTLSMADAVESVLQNHKLRKSWLAGEQQLLAQAERTQAPVNFRDINKTLSQALIGGDALQNLIDAQLAAAEIQPHGLLLLTDLEALHPYLRINTIEARLQGRVRCPVVVLYPGKREGKTSLRFLEFYPPDPNYRSEHIG
jgi:hypothetical protein